MCLGKQYFYSKNVLRIVVDIDMCIEGRTTDVVVSFVNSLDNNLSENRIRRQRVVCPTLLNSSICNLFPMKVERCLSFREVLHTLNIFGYIYSRLLDSTREFSQLSLVMSVVRNLVTYFFIHVIN